MVTVLVLGAAAATLWSARQLPVIESVEPTTAEPGASVTVLGRAFSSEGRLEVDGIAVPPEQIRRWTDRIIVFTLDESTTSGIVRVETSVGTSNGMFLTNTADLPKTITTQSLRIDDVQPGNAAVGTVVRFVGSGFGPRSGLSSITLRGNAESVVVPADERWIVRWSDEIIEWVVPPYVSPEEYRVTIDDVGTDAIVTVSEPVVERTYGPYQRYTVRQGLSVAGVDGSARAVFPLPPDSDLQEAGQLLRETTPTEVLPLPNVAVYRFFPVAEAEQAAESEEPPELLDRIVRVDLAGRRSVTITGGDSVDSRLLLEPGFQAAFSDLLAPIPLFFEATERIEALRRERVDLSQDAFSIVRDIYETVVDSLAPPSGDDSLDSGTRDILAALDGEAAHRDLYADVALLLGRSAGVPTRRVFGVFVDDSGESVPHRWIEHFLPEIGWIPADPAFGDGVFGDRVAAVASFYRGGDDAAADEDRVVPAFARLDRRRIAFTKDGNRAARVFPGAAALTPENTYAPGVLHVEFPSAVLPGAATARWEVPSVSPQFN